MSRSQQIAQAVEVAMVDTGFRLTVRDGKLVAWDLLEPDNPPIKIVTKGKTFRGLRAFARKL